MVNDYCVLKWLDDEIARHRIQHENLSMRLREVAREISRLELLRTESAEACLSKTCCPHRNVRRVEMTTLTMKTTFKPIVTKHETQALERAAGQKRLKTPVNA